MASDGGWGPLALAWDVAVGKQNAKVRSVLSRTARWLHGHGFNHEDKPLANTCKSLLIVIWVGLGLLEWLANTPDATGMFDLTYLPVGPPIP
jgi:hypothetical protein